MTECATSFISTKWWSGSLIVLALISHFLCNAQQVLQTNRFELFSSRDETAFDVLPAHENGLFLYRRVGTDRQDHIQLIKLDTAFKEQWKGFLPIDNRFVLVGKKVEEGKLYFLLRYHDFTRNNFQLFSIDVATGDFVLRDIKNFIPFTPTEFQVTHKGAIMGGYYNQVPVVIYYAFETGRARVLPGLLNEAGDLTQLKAYADGTFDVLISARNYKGQNTIFIKSYDENGDLLRNFALEPTDNSHLIFARSMKTPNNLEIVAGVFGGKNSLYSRGLFLAGIDLDGHQQLRYYNYGDLDNFFKYMKAKREARVKERIERRKIKGKKTKFNYRFLVHEIVPYKNQYILLGEAFYPKYVSTDHSLSPFFYNSGGMPSTMMRDGRLFDGYHYTHAVVMGFDQKGNLLWDNSFEINDVKTFTLEQFVKLEVQGDRIALLYLFDNELRTKIIQDDQVLEGKSIEDIKTNFDSDIVRKEQTSMNKLEYWYKDYFYAYGVQEIANAERGKRRVFFINKITCN
ncbi:hypothetical protein WBG78_24400 [Chryseolinea sp. T2]|uniref:hypothetical protein n=1 Tax=Chryseolinea sp. T2 TaxID=3129255 RepID=UPI00307816DB